ncbi:tRNA lysidine(34) synthetase TilS [Helicobacter anatolicus]|uniref:tRNA lysidine(34) synthetase TilS n=1 Tax=Helicobacter anatolicus TaxID=2905874 RepID=UPI001E5D0907|nr:tRNA lysidine(34) synthetase TilS [Helicobacter anatolicus]MCE3038817.1 tRNA lysidine(34) synthetase TilS [Helicobacter anatolicus]
MIDFSDLKNHKNLLGFSGGADSTALFFLMLKADICFDMAIVDYQIRKQSYLEVLYAQELAEKYNKKLYIYKSEKIISDFENHARMVRYDFFETLIKRYDYNHLILGHHLNDRLEWFLMQMIKGSGLNTILGFERVEKRDGYKIIRPMLELCKAEILEIVKPYKFFEDSSNRDTKFLRNKIRHSYANSLINENKQGILNTFKYLQKEKNRIYHQEILQLADIFYFEKKQELENLHGIDVILKQMGYVLSFKQREEIVKQKYSLILAKKYIIDCNVDFIFVSTQNEECVMPKVFRDEARRLLIPRRLRAKIFFLLKKGILKKNQIIFKKS